LGSLDLLGADTIGLFEKDPALSHPCASPVPRVLEGYDELGLRCVKEVTDFEEITHFVEGEGGRGNGVPQLFFQSLIAGKFVSEGVLSADNGLFSSEIELPRFC